MVIRVTNPPSLNLPLSFIALLSNIDNAVANNPVKNITTPTNNP